jgi:hypothetical protein
MPKPPNHAPAPLPRAVVQRLIGIARVPAEQRGIFEKKIAYVVSGDWELASLRSRGIAAWSRLFGAIPTLLELMETPSCRQRTWVDAFVTFNWTKTRAEKLCTESSWERAQVKFDELHATLELLLRRLNRIEPEAGSRAAEQLCQIKVAALGAQEGLRGKRPKHRPPRQILDDSSPRHEMFAALAYCVARGAGGKLVVHKNGDGPANYPYGTLPVFVGILIDHAPAGLARPCPGPAALARIKREMEGMVRNTQIVASLNPGSRSSS